MVGFGFARLRSRARQLIAVGGWALRRTWATSPAMVLALVTVTVVRGLLTGALALVARGLINAAIAAVHAGSGDLRPLLPWLAVGFGLAIVEAVSPLANKLFLQRLTDDLQLGVTYDVLQHAATLDMATLEDPLQREVLDRAQQNTATAFARFVNELQVTCTDLLQIVLMVAILVYLEPLVLVVAGPFAVPYMAFRWRTAKQRYAEQVARTTQQRWTRYFVSHLTSASAALEVKLLGLGPLFLRKYRELMLRFRDCDRLLYQRDFRGSAIFAVLTTVAFYLVFARVGLHVVRGALTVGDIAIFAGVSSRLRLTLEKLIVEISSVLEQAMHVAELRQFLRTRPQLTDGKGATPAVREGAVELRDVSFTYPGASRPALAGVTLRIAPGEVVAFVGENGAGKTTLVKLIARLYDPQSGMVLVDGLDVRRWSLAELHASIAFLSQGFGRYEASAGDNVAYGDWRRLLGDSERVEQIAAACGVDSLIRSLPRGYGTMVGRVFGEHELSGGQWQQLAVARALARDAALVILDEPTAHLDARAEYELFCRFRALAAGRTTILVSHRFTTLGMADRILVLDHGALVESGTHRDLIATDGVYARLYDMHRRQMSLDGAE